MEVHTLSVAELNARISDALAAGFPEQVWVQGEVHGLRVSAPGHVYFKLVEPGTLGRPTEASLNVVLFRGARQGVERVLAGEGVTLADDLQVRIRGEVVFYAPQGRVQLRMTAIDPAHTLGRLAADRERLLRALAAEGLLDANRSVPLPLVPLRIALVTSAGSAAAHDMIAELSRCDVGWQVSLIDARVQGAGAVESLVAAILTAARLEVDVIAVVRGGGSRTDLVAFDAEPVARAIATSPLPVLTGIGHEIDESVADRVAHRAFKTPTACAAFLCERVTELLARCAAIWETLTRRSTEALERQEALLRALPGRVAAGARTTVELAAARARSLQEAVLREPARHLDRADRELAALETQLRALDPSRVLARGWSITRAADGSLLRHVAGAPAGSTLLTTISDGTITSTVIETRPAPEEAIDG